MNITSSEQPSINSLLYACWTIKLETPLCLRSGSHSTFDSSAGGLKTRNVNISFNWNQEKNNGQQVSDLQFGLRVEGNQLVPVYTIAPKSLRGALRSWTISHLVRDEERRKLLTQLEQEGAAGEVATAALKSTLSTDPGLILVADVFGLAARHAGNGDDPSHRGLLQVETESFSKGEHRPWVQGDWAAESSDFGPENANRHITVRGPVDRLTHAAKDGGLHYFLEFSPDQTFKAIFRLVNPDPIHLGLLALWGERIDEGSLRIGGLASIGRGRMEVEKQEYTIFTPPVENPGWWPDKSEKLPWTTDVMAGIWDVRPIKDIANYREKLESWYSRFAN